MVFLSFLGCLTSSVHLQHCSCQQKIVVAESTRKGLITLPEHSNQLIEGYIRIRIRIMIKTAPSAPESHPA